MAHSEDQIALAAEYALGTLDASERTQVEAMISSDTDFAALVHAWELKLGALNQMVGLVEPRAEVWDRIKAAIGIAESSEASPVSPQAPPVPAPQVLREPAAAEIARPVVVEDTANMIRLSAQLRRWRSLALTATAIAVVLAAILVTGLYRPDLMPAALRQRPQSTEVGAPPAK
jgi:anti-sigma-K factor RskA